MIRNLLGRFESSDPQEVRQAGERLLEQGHSVAKPLAQVLREGTPSARRAAAFLLGRIGASSEAQTALVGALSDPDPKVRKNAVISLGNGKDIGSLSALVALLEREDVVWVHEGRTAQEIEPNGKAAGEIRQLTLWLCDKVSLLPREQVTKLAKQQAKA